MPSETDHRRPEGLMQEWDVIVVGTGMGGATLGHRLASAGRKVLFCELGPHRRADLLRGAYPELNGGRRGTVLDASGSADLMRAGRCFDTLVDESHRRPRSFVPFIGSGAGGSSALYGMALERFMRSGLSAGRGRPAPTRMPPSSNGGPSATTNWRRITPAPKPCTECAASRIPSPQPNSVPAAPPVLLPPPPISQAGAGLVAHLAAQGLHPYRLPVACEFEAGCLSCQGVLCPMPCKNDSGRICLQPALREHGAALISGCRVLAVRTAGRRATGVLCRWSGQDLELRARVVVLAAGALQTPLILLRSRDGQGREGCTASRASSAATSCAI
ncbi:MAG: GMC family oxidoreductase [Betaproteobacteria bacterium]|nr:GMC family oxidoreductase [Betaproteobacteria bacterium]